MPIVPPANFKNLQAKFLLYSESAHGTQIICDRNVTGRRTAVTAVPEPSTTALMALGLGAVGFASRRRRQSLR